MSGELHPHFFFFGLAQPAFRTGRAGCSFFSTVRFPLNFSLRGSPDPFFPPLTGAAAFCPLTGRSSCRAGVCPLSGRIRQCFP